MIVSIAKALKAAEQLEAISDSAWLDAQLLLGKVLDCNRSYLYTWPEKHLSDAQLAQYEQLIARRLQGEPVAYLLGEKEFWSLPLNVNPHTLIPRPETELLVELVLALLPADKTQSIADLGTGTGAIALALATERPIWHLTGCDYLPAVVALAEANRQRLALDNVKMLQSDWFDRLTPGFDMIVSNPPYIDAADLHLTRGDVRYEPKSALVAGNRGLEDIKLIIEQAPCYLNNNGWLLLEHGYQQAGQVRELLRDNGFKQVETRCDIAGQERASFGQLPEREISYEG